MTASPLKPAASALAVFGILLALLSQSVCLAEFLQHPNQIERHGYIRTPDEGRQARESIDVVTTTALDGETRHLAPADTTKNKKCRLWKMHIANGKNGVVGDHQWMCAFDDPGLSQTVVFGGYSTKTIVGVGDDNIIEYLHINGASSGKTILVLSDNVEVLNDKVIVVLGQVIGLEDYNSKEETTNGMNTQIEAAEMTGEQKTLVVRVNFQTNSDATTAIEISDICFTNEEYSLKSQYAKCSYNKFTLQEYIPSPPGPESPVAQGVVDVTVARSEDSGFELVENVKEKSDVEFYKLFPGKNSDNSPEQFDLVIFCFPPEIDSEWGGTLGFAYENSWNSYYQSNECRTNISTLMHEIGHNIGLQHSGEHLGSLPDNAEEVYGDGSGIMGNSDGQMCFNTVKSYDLRWYADKYEELMPTISDNTSYKLNGVVDYGDTTTDRYVGIKIENYYIGFNRMADFNIGTQEAGDMVTVTKKLVDVVDGATPSFDGHSNLVKILNVGENFDFEVSGTLIKLKFVEIENGKDAIIEFNSNTGSSDPSGAPSTSLSNSPSIAPSIAPSGAPSGTPSESGQPSTLQSNAPSTSLSDAPSGQPSPVPSTGPSNFSSTVPSGAPSGVRSVVPSGQSSTAPSTSPSVNRSSAPSGTPSLFDLSVLQALSLDTQLSGILCVLSQSAFFPILWNSPDSMYTLFAPVNAALQVNDALQGILAGRCDLSGRDGADAAAIATLKYGNRVRHLANDIIDDLTPENLEELSKNHIVSGIYLRSDITDGLTLNTLQGGTIVFGVDGDVITVNGIVITFSDNAATNGAVHKINGILSVNPPPPPTASPKNEKKREKQKKSEKQKKGKREKSEKKSKKKGK